MYKSLMDAGIGNWGFGIQVWEHWTQFLKPKDFNWITFTFFEFYVEYGGYKGRYFEVNFVLLGLGINLEVYERVERRVFVRQILEDGEKGPWSEMTFEVPEDFEENK